MKKQYLGDAVYADFNGLYLIITTEDGRGPTNTIALEPEVWEALENYIKHVKKESKQASRLDRFTE